MKGLNHGGDIQLCPRKINSLRKTEGRIWEHCQNVLPGSKIRVGLDSAKHLGRMWGEVKHLCDVLFQPFQHQVNSQPQDVANGLK